MEELLLGAFLTYDELDIVDEKDIVVSVFSLNSVVVMLFLLRMASISSLVKVSEVTYSILDFALFFNMKWAMACIRWVLPSPTPPYIKRGLYISPGDSATARAAAWARLLFPPTTKVSKYILDSALLSLLRTSSFSFDRYQ